MQNEEEKLFSALTPLQKEIATNTLKGMNAANAYRASKGKANSESAIRAGVTEILANPSVKAYIDLMRSIAVKDTILRREEALERLSALARTSLSDLVEFGSYEVDIGGKLIKQSLWSIKDSVEQDQIKIAAISELSTGKDGLKIKTHSPLQAIKQISDMQGWNISADSDNNEPQKLEITINGTVIGK